MGGLKLFFSLASVCYLVWKASGQRRDVGDLTSFFQVCGPRDGEREGRSCGQKDFGSQRKARGGLLIEPRLSGCPGIRTQLWSCLQEEPRPPNLLGTGVACSTQFKRLVVRTSWFGQQVALTARDQADWLSPGPSSPPPRPHLSCNSRAFGVGSSPGGDPSVGSCLIWS